MDNAQSPAPAATPVSANEDPGHGFGIASLVTSLLGLGLVGLILGILGLNKSKKVGRKNGLALAGIILGIINIAVVALFLILMASGLFTLFSKCNELGPGIHTVEGIEITCSAGSGESSPKLFEY